MKVAIHHREGSFSERWIEYCVVNNIDYKIVNVYENNIIEQLKGCDVFMWHSHHLIAEDMFISKRLIPALQNLGVKIYPDNKTSWHFDDKVAQKYLLEACNEPLVPSYVFYNKIDAIRWASKVTYPKVFKLKGGAGATNVYLVKSEKECKKIIKKSFGKGFSQFNSKRLFLEKLISFFKCKIGVVEVIKSFGRVFFPSNHVKFFPKEKGYAYFQEFIADNDGDIRIIVIGGKYAYGMKRLNRPNDFRASGSSNFVYDKLPKEIVNSAFQVAKKLSLQTVAFDFVIDKSLNKPLIVEISYAFGTKGSSQCNGYWTDDLKWHESKFEPQFWLMELLLEKE